MFVALDYVRKTRDHVRAVKADAHAEERLYAVAAPAAHRS